MDLAKAAEIFSQLETALDSPISDLQIEELATKMVRWEDFVPFFELSEAEQEEIRRNNERNYRLQKRAALYAWKDKKGRQATLRGFLSELDRVEKRSSTSTGVLESFRKYLVECYAVAPHPSHSSWPGEGEAYVDLPLFEAPLKEEDGSQPSTQPRNSVKLNEVFHFEAKRKIVLLEGVAGCGKTTLTWHAYQMWAKGKMLEFFPLLIHVSLEYPEIQSATSLADIIPHPSSETREAVAKTIAEQHGKGVCFLLNGWDELPPKAQRKGSFLYRLVEGRPGRMMLSDCSVVITSRPQAAGTLYPLLKSKSKILIGRLDRRRIDDLLDECLSLEESEELLKKFEQRSQLANLCDLPINAMIVIHLFRSGVRTLPETRTGLFKALLRNMLIRHTQQRTKHDVRELGEEFEFEQLPVDLQGKFSALCRLAFQGIMEQRKVFEMAALKALGLTFPVDTLSLMEAHLTVVGFMRSFSFLHYSVQEFLAAWHMTRLDSEEQAKAVSDILHSSPLSPVLPFFAGLTRLSNPAVRDVLLEVNHYPLDSKDILESLARGQSDRRRLALAQLNCIYESQDDSICQLVLHPWLPGHESPDHFIFFSFTFLGLEPSDCLSLGYFLAHRDYCALDLSSCRIGDSGYEALITQLEKSGNQSQIPCRTRYVRLTGNIMTIRSMRLLSGVLQSSLLSSLDLAHCWPPNQVATNMKYLIKGLSRRSTCFDILLPETVTTKHIYYLVLLLTVCPIQSFRFGNCDIHESITLIAAALKQNSLLKEVWLKNCGIRDSDLIALGRALRGHKSFDKLVVNKSTFSTSAVKKFFKVNFFSNLRVLDIGRELNSEEKTVHNELLDHRRRNNLRRLSVVNIIVPQWNQAIEATVKFFSLPKDKQTRPSKQ